MHGWVALLCRSGHSTVNQLCFDKIKLKQKKVRAKWASNPLQVTVLCCLDSSEEALFSGGDRRNLISPSS